MNRIYLSPPDVGIEERRLLLDAFDSNWIAPLGPHVDQFEAEMAHYIGVRDAAALSSGTAALHLALVLLGVGTGDRVACSTFTFAATANAIRYCGAEPVFIDSDNESWNMDPDLLKEELKRSGLADKLPKAVIVVDLYGQTADYDRLQRICASYSVPIIEDAAEALGSRYRMRMAGSLAMMSCLSFNGNKIITTSGGGMLLSDSIELTQRARFLASQARDPAPHYQHSVVGYNYRLSNLLAALGRGQLKSLPDKVERRRSIYRRYYEHLSGIEGISFMPEPPWSEASRWLTCIEVDDGAAGFTSTEIRVALERNNIESRPLWKPMHLQPAFQECRIVGGAVSERLFRRGLCLPSGSALRQDEIERVTSTIMSLLWS